MITGNDKNSGNIFYQQIIDYLYTDKFVEDLKNVLQNKNFQSQKNKIKDYFRAPIKHINYLKKMRYSPQQKPNDVKKEYFYFKEDRELLRKIFVIQSTFKYSPDYCYLPIKSEQFDWNSFFLNFERENQSLKGDELSIQIGKYLQNNISLKPNNRSKSFSEYINYIYSSNSGTYNIFRFLNKTLQGLSDSPLFPEDFHLTKIIKQNQGTNLSLLQWKKKLFYSSKLNTNYKYTNYLMYFDGVGLREMPWVELGEFLNDLYYSEKGFKLISNPNDNYHNNFKFTNLTEFNNHVLKGSEEIYLNLFTKLSPYYYTYITGIISEGEFLPVVVPEMRNYILA